MSAVEIQKQTLAYSLCRIPALTSFVENFQEGLQVYLKRSPLQMFAKVAGKFKKNWCSLRKFKIFYKFFYADAETSKWQFFYFNEKLL